jgi:hypothetical protein
MNRRIWILLAAVLVAVFAVYLFPAIPQNETYHNFADARAFFGVPNFLNVASNVFFLFVGLAGIWFLLQKTTEDRPLVDPRERWPYFAFFVGVTLTAFGSAWYHLNPDDRTLVWDRVPMAIGFMALVAAVTAERVDVTAGVRLLLPLIAIGISSVVYWEFTQMRGHGDLRPYALVQFGGLLVMALLILLFPARYTRTADLGIALGLYALAKVFEAIDKPVYRVARSVVSGHTIKHLVAALATYWVFRMLRLRKPLSL